MKITPWERARYWVESSQEGVEPYLVDMLEYNRSGQCDCEHFRIRIQPKLEAGQKVEACTCKHIEAVKEFIALQTSAAMWDPPKTCDKLWVEYVVPRVLFKFGIQEREPKTKIITYGKARPVDNRISSATQTQESCTPVRKVYQLNPEKTYGRGR